MKRYEQHFRFYDNHGQRIFIDGYEVVVGGGSNINRPLMGNVLIAIKREGSFISESMHRVRFHPMAENNNEDFVRVKFFCQKSGITIEVVAHYGRPDFSFIDCQKREFRGGKMTVSR